MNINSALHFSSKKENIERITVNREKNFPLCYLYSSFVICYLFSVICFVATSRIQTIAPSVRGLKTALAYIPSLGVLSEGHSVQRQETA